jgi:hypothetical protein
MASTRNINTPGNYSLEQRQYKQNQQYTLYKNSQYGEAYSTKMPGNGLLPGQLPVEKLSGNPIQIESFLFGINSTNLVNPEPCLVPELKCLETANIYAKPATIMPLPLVIERNRPFPCP